MQEQVIINGLLYDERYSRAVLPHMKSEYFSGGHKEIFEIISEFNKKYHKMPSREALIVELSEKKLPEGLYDDATAVISQTENQPSDYDWMVDMTEKWAQDKSVYNGIMKSINILDGKEKGLDKGSIPSILTEALSISFDTKLGHDYFDDAEKQWEYYNNPVNRIQFSLDIFNQITKGGVTRKTLSIVMAGINAGKTTFLIDLSKNYLAQGLNVVYFTLEIAEEVLRERADVSSFNMNFDKMRALQKTQYLNRVKAIKEKTSGSFNIKQFPSSTVHVGHLRHYLNELKLKKGIVPDVIIVDYLTLMLSCNLPRSSRADTNGYFTAVSEELRGLMVEMNAVGWSAAQFNRGGQTSEDPHLGDTGLSIGVQATSDLTLAFSVPEELGKRNQALGKVLKNRFSNKAHITKFIVGLDNDVQTFYDVSVDTQKEAMGDEFEQFAAMKKPTPNPSTSLEWQF